ncbi:zinc finger protein 597 [Tamandua tetradactyla]|uniref:zinc finger protein 597 n=1 Tax=Tamandua tetradactyla TaxID=48850 RepID=UPI00405433EE
MASLPPATAAQGPVLFEDLAVYFSQEECVSLHPAQRSLSRDVAQECLEDMALLSGESEVEVNQQLSLESMELEELALEKCSIAIPLVCYPEESAEDEAESPEGTISTGTPICRKSLRSLLVTIENHTPLVELSQCLGTRALSEILDFPWEEASSECKSPECDQSFSNNSYPVPHQKIRLGKKRYECGDCGKIFSYTVNLKTHRRIHSSQKPYPGAEYGTAFCQHSHLSQHMNIHVKEKSYTCGLCRRGFMWLPGLAKHQKTHSAEQAHMYAKHGKYFSQKMNPALHKKTHTLASQSQSTRDGKNLGHSPHLVHPKKGPKGEKAFNHCEESLLSFPTFKPLKCLKCETTFLDISELISHQNVHRREKPHKCKICVESFILDSELACRQKSHVGEEPFKCTMCEKISG